MCQLWCLCKSLQDGVRTGKECQQFRVYSMWKMQEYLCPTHAIEYCAVSKSMKKRITLGLHMPPQKCNLIADDGASPPPEWCTPSAKMVHGGRERGAPDRHAGDHSGMPLRFRMDSPLDTGWYRHCRLIRSQMASARVGSYRFSCHTLVSYWEQKMVRPPCFWPLPVPAHPAPLPP